MAAHFFLWTKPKNAELMALRFHLYTREVSGEALWWWIKRIGALKGKTIIWHKGLDSPHSHLKVLISRSGSQRILASIEIHHGAQTNSRLQEFDMSLA
jgi:hypothetical protein